MHRIGLVSVACAFAVACGSSDGGDDKFQADGGAGGIGGASGSGGSAPGGAGPGGTAGAGPGGAGGTSGDAGTGGVGGGVPGGISCASDPPAGAPEPAALQPYSGGTCPALVEGRNLFMTGGKMREMILVLPQNVGADEELPVVFFWHWMGGDAQDFVDRGELAQATNDQRFIAIVPESAGAGVLGIPALDVKWPFDVSQSQARIDEELVLFDDLLTCVSEQFTTNRNCVSSAGVSAGALFTGQLGGFRGDYLASIVSLSGGVGGIIRGWGDPAHKMPALVLTGGPTDNCFNLLNFQAQSEELKTALAAGGHFLVECVHNCGHAQPPVTPPPGQTAFAPFWDFVFAHPFWLAPGESPYNDTGLPASFPEWCAIGHGNAVARTGMCVDPSEC